MSVDYLDLAREYGLLHFSEEEPSLCPIASIATGSLAIDRITGVGGIPRGKLTEIYGRPSTGKSTLGLHIIAETLRNKEVAVLIDADHSFNLQYARAAGVPMKHLLVQQPPYGEIAYDVLVELLKTGVAGCILVDSIAALTPRSELQKPSGEGSQSARANLLENALRKITPVLAGSNTAVVFLNQMRQDFRTGGMRAAGGSALPSYAHLRIELSRTAMLTENNQQIGFLARAETVANKLAVPKQHGEFTIRFGQGIDTYSDLVQEALTLQLLHRRGTWFYYNDERLGQGRVGVVSYLKTHPELYRELHNRIVHTGVSS